MNSVDKGFAAFMSQLLADCTPPAGRAAQQPELHRFESVSHLPRRNDLGRLITSEKARRDAWALVRNVAREHGFTGLHDIGVRRRPSQRSFQAPVVVFVTLRGMSTLAAGAPVPLSLSVALDALANSVCCDFHGVPVFETERWTLRASMLLD